MLSILVVYLVAQMIDVSTRDYELTRTIKVKDVIESQNIYKLEPENFNFAISLKSRNEKFLANPSRYFRVVLLYEEGIYDYQAQSQKIINEKIIDAPNCSQENFPISDQEQQIYNLTDMFCFDQSLNEAFVNGQWISKKNQNVAATVRSCQVAATEEEIKNGACAK